MLFYCLLALNVTEKHEAILVFSFLCALRFCKSGVYHFSFGLPKSIFLMLVQSWCSFWIWPKFHCVWQIFSSLCMGTWQLSSFMILLLLDSVCVHAQSLQLCPALCNPVAWSLPGSSVHEDSPVKNSGVGCQKISRVSSWPRDWTCVSYDFCTGRWDLYN